MEDPQRVPAEPGAYLRLRVSSIVVEDDVDELASRHRRLDGVEEANELLIPMALHAAADDGAVKNVSAAKSVVVPWRL